VSAMKLLRSLPTIGIFGALTFAAVGAAAGDPTRPTQGSPIVLHNCNITAVQKAHLATDRPGVIAVVDPKEGDTVKKGQPIVRLMDEVPQANWEVAKLVADDVIEVEYATRLNAVDALEYKKSVEANRKAPGTISEIELRRLDLAEQKSALSIDKAKHDIAVNEMKAKQAKAELDTFRILAPFDGFISEVLKHRGEAVKQGDTILTMVNTDVVHVEGWVKERDIWRVKHGCPVEVVLDIKGSAPEVAKQVFHGKIGFVDQVANVGDTRVWAEVPNPGNLLRPGFIATMTILSADEATAGVAPQAPTRLDPPQQLGAPTQFGSKIASGRDSQTQ
jgi:RND family efflux transporter MFP subunit